MKFEYNGNLEEYERVNVVANEIIEIYPNINLDYAMVIASLEEPITMVPNAIIKFKRLYNILFVMQNNSDIFKLVLNDIKNMYIQYIKEEKIEPLVDIIMSEILNYVDGERYDFPIISEFY